jgi:hypothetical protein
VKSVVYIIITNARPPKSIGPCQNRIESLGRNVAVVSANADAISYSQATARRGGLITPAHCP